MKPYLTVFIPAYNEEKIIIGCVDNVVAKLGEYGISYEILIIDDGSQDQTGSIADRIAETQAFVRVHHHGQNRGMGAAFLTALGLALGEWLILIPADLALVPDELQRYLGASSMADIVVGVSTDRSDYTAFRRLVSWTNIRLIQILFGMQLRQFQYICMYRIDILRSIEIQYQRSSFFLAEILIKARDMGARLVEVEICYAPRRHGEPTGASPDLIIRTVSDIFNYWLRWMPGKIQGVRIGRAR